mmetsp:Transcript_35683/g.111648  ORF Transcript_35683/g.111648 Transcript_35683/m.111648 type:complete len:213 (-) Transcript_35683:971-1609(-)
MNLAHVGIVVVAGHADLGVLLVGPPADSQLATSLLHSRRRDPETLSSLSERSVGVHVEDLQGNADRPGRVLHLLPGFPSWDHCRDGTIAGRLHRVEVERHSVHVWNQILHAHHHGVRREQIVCVGNNIGSKRKHLWLALEHLLGSRRHCSIHVHQITGITHVRHFCRHFLRLRPFTFIVGRIEDCHHVRNNPHSIDNRINLNVAEDLSTVDR